MNGLDDLGEREPTAAEEEIDVPVADGARYTDALLQAFSDYTLSSTEVDALVQLREALDLPEEYVRAIHAGVCSRILARFLDNVVIDADEENHLAFIWECLRRLGWAPGDRQI